MNQNNNQIQQNNQVSQEELAKTQVLNLTDVQEIAKFERKTSKRPALLFAIAGVLAITLGLSYPHIMTSLDAMPSNIKTEIKPLITDTDIVKNKVQENKTSCVFTSPRNDDGTSGMATYNLSFDEEDKLQGYTMTLELDALPNDNNGILSVQKYYNLFKSLNEIPLNGYKSTTTTTATGMKSVVVVDLSKLNKSTLTSTHLSNPFSNVPYNFGDTKEAITGQLIASGYVCE